MRKAELLRRIERLEERVRILEWGRITPKYPDPIPPYKLDGCRVCGLDGMSGYVCPRTDCPTRITA